MVHQNVSLPDLREHIRLLRQFRYRLRFQVPVLLQMVKAIQPVHFHKESQIQRSADGIDIPLLNRQFIPDQLQQSVVDPFLHLQTDDLPPLPLLKLFLDLLQQILRFVLLNRQIRISHDAERVAADDIIVEEQLVHIAFDHFLQQNDLRPLLRRNRHKAGQDARYLYGGKFQFSPAVLLLHQRPQIQGFIANQRKRSGGIHRHRRQNRIDVIRKIPVHIGRFLFAQILVMSDNMQPVFQKMRQERTVVYGILLFHKRMRLLIHLRKLFRGGHARNILFLIPGADHIL